jgi:outer membrane biosynthesis protein TonB
MEDTEKKDKRKGLIASFVFHTVMLVLFAIFGMSYTTPPPEDGMLINFGYSDSGSGDVEEEPVQNSEEQEVQEAAAAPQPSEEVKSYEEVVSQEVEESVKVEKKEKKPEPAKEVKEPQPTQEELRQAEQKKKLEERFAMAKAAKNANQGEKTGPGNQGNPDGVPNAPQGKVPGKGSSGISFDLGGRRMMTTPKIKDNSQDEGRVVVTITVDRYGKVINAVPGARGSTTASTHLYRLAKEAAFNTNFDADPNASVQQMGSMTFIFEVQ